MLNVLDIQHSAPVVEGSGRVTFVHIQNLAATELAPEDAPVYTRRDFMPDLRKIKKEAASAPESD